MCTLIVFEIKFVRPYECIRKEYKAMTIEQLWELNRAVNYLCNEYSKIVDNPNVEYPITYALKLAFDHYNQIEQPRSSKAKGGD